INVIINDIGNGTPDKIERGAETKRPAFGIRQQLSGHIERRNTFWRRNPGPHGIRDRRHLNYSPEVCFQYMKPPIPDNEVKSYIKLEMANAIFLFLYIRDE